MLNQFQVYIDQLPEHHPLHILDTWHLKQMIRQIKLRARKAMIPPFAKIEQYQKQGWLVSKLYAVLVSENQHTVNEFLQGLSIIDTRKLMWQRFTKHSYTDDTYLPPIPQDLERWIQTQDMEQLWKNLEEISTACDEGYWEVVIEEAENKSKETGRTVLIEVLDFYLDEFTWWNTYAREGRPIFELRDPSGHGIRFDMDLEQLIAFVEPDEDGIIFSFTR